ncbi:MAG: hypothetical protein J1G06_04585 [Oscillospiraceae bacterium]|nr:hypothetical protein [Oscillospiraceae bacterium]
MSVEINTDFNGEVGLDEWYPIVKSNEIALAEGIDAEEKARDAAVDKLREECENRIINSNHIANGAVLGKHYWQPLPTGTNLDTTRGNGFFYFDDSTLQNCPCTRGVFIPMHYNREGQSLERLQIVVDTKNSKIYTRWAKHAGSHATFGDWKDILEEYELPPAAVGILGGIKPLSSGSTNRSGLVIGEDGTTYVNTRADRGITRDGAGQIGINPATTAEAAAGTEAYKPITPETLKAELDRRNTYSKTPVRIGTWADGTPVWRKAFVVEYKNLQDKDAVKIQDIGLDFEVNCYTFGLSQCCTVKTGNNTEYFGDVVPAFATRNIDPSYLFNIKELNSSIQQMLESKGGTFYGYIDFVTAESNIKEV